MNKQANEYEKLLNLGGFRDIKNQPLRDELELFKILLFEIDFMSATKTINSYKEEILDLGINDQSILRKRLQRMNMILDFYNQITKGYTREVSAEIKYKKGQDLLDEIIENLLIDLENGEYIEEDVIIQWIHDLFMR